jgi:class 3 adenylate cyclase
MPFFRSISLRSRRSSAASATHASPDGGTLELDGGLRAVMFTDIVGSTALTARVGDASAFDLVRVHARWSPRSGRLGGLM